VDGILDYDLLNEFCHDAVRFIGGLNDACGRYEINTPERIAAFLAQVAHGSGGFHYVEELASGAAYEGRKDLGNTEPGDGVKFKGRGLIQITGRNNYKKLSDAFKVDFIGNPQWLERPSYAALSAGWFWDDRNLNTLADAGDFEHITQRINGGLNGYDSRLSWWNKAKHLWPETE